MGGSDARSTFFVGRPSAAYFSGISLGSLNELDILFFM